jgi:hypothetical protein
LLHFKGPIVEKYVKDPCAPIAYVPAPQMASHGPYLTVFDNGLDELQLSVRHGEPTSGSFMSAAGVGRTQDFVSRDGWKNSSRHVERLGVTLQTTAEGSSWIRTG